MNIEMIEEDVDVAQVAEADIVLDIVKEAIRLLDVALSETGNREIVPAGEMSDLLLDVRLVLTPLIS